MKSIYISNEKCSGAQISRVQFGFYSDPESKNKFRTPEAMVLCANLSASDVSSVLAAQKDIPMALSSVAQPPHESIRGVHFAMLDGTVLVNILIMHAALQAMDWSPPGSGDYLARFYKHRSVLEEIASGKHGRGQIEENGSIVIQKGDR